MQTKNYNAYRITHKNGSIEEINAESLVEALNNMEVSEEYSPVVQTFMQKEGIRTLIENLPEEIPFTSVVSENAGGSIATPLSGTVHAGDMLSFKAIPAKNYEFVNWKCNGEVISEDAEFVYTMKELKGEASAIFMATFALADVNWVTAVEPEQATAQGVIAFPMSGSTPANANAQFLAVEATGYTFNHWERNGESVGTNKLLSVTVTPLADNETEAVYKAVFTAE